MTGDLCTYGPPLDSTEVDRVVAACTRPDCSRGLVSGGEGCPACIDRLGMAWPAATRQLRDAALLDRADELARRAEDSIEPHISSGSGDPLRWCAECATDRYGHAPPAAVGVMYQCPGCCECWVAICPPGPERARRRLPGMSTVASAAITLAVLVLILLPTWGAWWLLTVLAASWLLIAAAISLLLGRVITHRGRAAPHGPRPRGQ